MIHVAVEARNQELTRVSPEGILTRSIEVRRLHEESGDMLQGAEENAP